MLDLILNKIFEAKVFNYFLIVRPLIVENMKNKNGPPLETSIDANFKLIKSIDLNEIRLFYLVQNPHVFII